MKFVENGRLALTFSPKEMICWDVTDNWRNLFEIEGHVNPILG